MHPDQHLLIATARFLEVFLVEFLSGLPHRSGRRFAEPELVERKQIEKASK
jgi:hypothetical protein